MTVVRRLLAVLRSWRRDTGRDDLEPSELDDWVHENSPPRPDSRDEACPVTWFEEYRKGRSG